jgi:hypothetical protein
MHEMSNACRILVQESQKDRDYLEYEEVDGRIKIK